MSMQCIIDLLLKLQKLYQTTHAAGTRELLRVYALFVAKQRAMDGTCHRVTLLACCGFMPSAT